MIYRVEGDALLPRNILKYFQRELERLGLPKIPFHNLRHSCAGFHLARGTSPKFVQELLGHATVAFTLRKYSHLLPGVAEEAVDMLNQSFASNSVKQTRLRGRAVTPPNFFIERLYYCASRVSVGVAIGQNTIEILDAIDIYTPEKCKKKQKHTEWKYWKSCNKSI